jgi:hypothetical protein
MTNENLQNAKKDKFYTQLKIYQLCSSSSFLGLKILCDCNVIINNSINNDAPQTEKQ